MVPSISFSMASHLRNWERTRKKEPDNLGNGAGQKRKKPQETQLRIDSTLLPCDPQIIAAVIRFSDYGSCFRRLGVAGPPAGRSRVAADWKRSDPSPNHIPISGMPDRRGAAGGTSLTGVVENTYSKVECSVLTDSILTKLTWELPLLMLIPLPLIKSYSVELVNPSLYLFHCVDFLRGRTYKSWTIEVCPTSTALILYL